ncbi:MAG: pyridoxal phosphate-dependent aminotransferase [Oligoflexia bacterium]|nr:pyridoxal phosphate-dependent aminotransferase [Oligoflexia bacterium]
MPRHPALSPRITTIPAGVFSTVAHRIAALKRAHPDITIYPLHIGDTWREPPAGCRLQDLVDQPAGIHRYGPPLGQPTLIQAIADRRGVDPRRIMVSVGATGGLSSALGALLEPGDQVMLLAPYWPLIRGIVQTRGGMAVDVPFFATPPGAEPLPESVEDRLAPWLTKRTVALYLNSPNNPTGRVLTRAELDAVARFARRHDLWLLADEVYEDFAWARPHVPLASVDPDRTIAAHSFSKAYGMAGNRVGFVIGPEDLRVMAQLRKVHMHASYSAPVGPQICAERVLRQGGDWLVSASAAYRQAGEVAAAALGLPPPEGGTFLFVDVSSRLDERGMQGFQEDAIDRHLLVAPGSSCGRHYASCVRICFTSAPPEQMAAGVEVLAGMLR